MYTTGKRITRLSITGRWAHWRLFVGAVALSTVLSVSACGDPERNRFVDLCVDNGDTALRCNCTFDTLQSEVGTIDSEFVDFVADFAKWGLKKGEAGLSRFEIMEKYDLGEAEFMGLAEIVGGTMIRAFGSC